MSYFLKKRVENTEGGIDNLSVSLNSTNATVNAINIATTALQGNVASAQTSITALNTTTAAIQGSVSGAQQSIGLLNVNLALNVSILDDKITQVRGNVSNLQGNVSAAETSITALNTATTAVQGNVAAAQTSITALSSVQLYSGAAIASLYTDISSYTNNQYYFGTTNFDFDNYIYNIEFVINQSVVYAVNMYWAWDFDVNFANYQMNYLDWDGAFLYTGGNQYPSIFYTQNTSGFQASFKGTLRALPAPSPTNYNRLILEGATTMNFQANGTRGYGNVLPRVSRSIGTYAGATQNSIAQFNGNHTFTLWAAGNNYRLNHPIHFRLTKEKIGSQII
jgi:hypothetical protein